MLKSICPLILVMIVSSISLAQNDGPQPNGPEPRDYLQVIIDHWISQLQEAERIPHHFYNPQYMTLKVSDVLRKNSKFLDLTAAILTKKKPSVASEWCHVPYMECTYLIYNNDISEALHRLQNLRKDFFSKDNYCTGSKEGLQDAEGRLVSYYGWHNSTDEVCKFAGPIIYGKCILTYNGGWEFYTPDGSWSGSYASKADAFEHLTWFPACEGR
jgi:hypothetical protein